MEDVVGVVVSTLPLEKIQPTLQVVQISLFYLMPLEAHPLDFSCSL